MQDCFLEFTSESYNFQKKNTSKWGHFSDTLYMTLIFSKAYREIFLKQFIGDVKKL